MGSALPSGEPAPRDGRLPRRIDSAADFGVYLHVPFCRVRCGYCDFNTYTATELRGARREDYAATVRSEMELSREVLASAGAVRPASTVFFGGGTPTLLPAADLVSMIDGVRETFSLTPGAEVTIEANPDTVTDEIAVTLAEAGATRLSIGMQSAVPAVLATLDRSHSRENVGVAVRAARRAGLDISIDLIYGAPGETLGDWEASLDAALALAPDHVSAYALIVEEGTSLARRIRRGEIDAPDDDLQADMHELADERLADAGYEWYEVSNWARGDTHRSRHNLGYWSGSDWWGFGPGAHSHVAGVRWWNVKHPAAYAQRLSAGVSPAAARELPNEDSRRLERVMLGTRIREGLPAEVLDAGGRAAVPGLVADGLADEQAAEDGRLVLTLRGRLLADAVVRAVTP